MEASGGYERDRHIAPRGLTRCGLLDPQRVRSFALSDVDGWLRAMRSTPR